MGPIQVINISNTRHEHSEQDGVNLQVTLTIMLVSLDVSLNTEGLCEKAGGRIPVSSANSTPECYPIQQCCPSLGDSISWLLSSL
jgi:hypothetical protein